MTIRSLMMDSATHAPVVVLKELGGERMLPIWLGFVEATILASELKNAKFSRPMTHDLLKNMIELANVEVRKIEINHRIDNICCAVIHLKHCRQEISLDARPSDALILSLRFNAPIFAADEIIEHSRQITLSREPGDTSSREDKWKQVLESLRPEDFGKYPM